MEKKTLDNLTQFIQKLGNSFDSRSIIQWAEQKFFIKPFNLIQISFKQTQICHSQIQKKYAEKKILHWPDQWHKSQRRIFIQILVCFCKIENKHPISMDLEDWQYLSSLLFDKNPMFLKFQSFTLLKIHRKMQWMGSDDKLVKEFVRIYGQGNWNEISKKIFYQSEGSRFFSSKQIRERWYNHISQKIVKGPWTQKEDKQLMEHVLYKNKHWCQIVRILNKKRTQHMIKNRFKILMKKSFNIPQEEPAQIRQLLNEMREKFGSQMTIGKKSVEKSNQSSEELINENHLNKQSLQIRYPVQEYYQEGKQKMVQQNPTRECPFDKFPPMSNLPPNYPECYINFSNFTVFPNFQIVSYFGESPPSEQQNFITEINHQQPFILPNVGFECYNAFPSYWQDPAAGKKEG